MADYIRPVNGYRGVSSWSAHQRRSPRSTEPGTDYYVPIGTPVVAPRAGVVQMTGDSINPATGRFVYILFDRDSAGRLTSGRALHLSRRVVSVGQRVRQGQIIGYSGASGYGKEDWSSDPATGGAHVHWTFWLSHSMRFGYDSSGRPYTVDFENYVSGSPAGGTGDDDMQADERNWLFELYQQLLPGKAGVKTQGDVNKHLYAGVAAAQAANAAAQAAKAAAESLVADFKQGQAGVNPAGRLYLLLIDAAKNNPAPVQVDIPALASALAEALGPIKGGPSLDEIEARFRSVLTGLTLKTESV